MTTATSAERRKRVFSDRTLTLGDLRVIHAQMATTGNEVRIVANDTHLFDLEPLPRLAAEEVFIRDIILSVVGEDDEVLQFTYEPSYLEIEAGSDPAFRRPFAIATALIEAKPTNAFHTCILDLDDERAPALPRVAIADESASDSRRARMAEAAARKKAAAEAITERVSAPLREPSSLEIATARMQRATATRPSTTPPAIPPTVVNAASLDARSAAQPSAPAALDPAPEADSRPSGPVGMSDAQPPNRGVVALLRRLWNGPR
ncbi:MAG: hypothetical protein H0X45_01255 [Planctomycetes bacterium]|nr:hypothetical protein [Planctomycetota bacterium]